MNEPDFPVENAYADEQDKLDDTTKEVGEVWLAIADVLLDKGYNLRPCLVNGLPDVVLEKR